MSFINSRSFLRSFLRKTELLEKKEAKMKCKFRMGFFTVLIVLLWLTLSNIAFAQEGKLSAKVYPVDAPPMVVEDFTLNGKTKFYAKWRGSYVTLESKKIKEIKYLNPGSHTYMVEITFSSGKKDKFELMPGVFHGKSEFGEWSMHPEKALRIEFSPPSAIQVYPSAEYSKYDQILFKNGDTVSGQIQTKAFKLRTSYANLNFETPQIGYIDFEEGSQNSAVMGLRIGDKLSGILEPVSIRLLMRSGAEVKLDKRKIKKINFVLVRR
jgi:hypothetical protein